MNLNVNIVLPGISERKAVIDHGLYRYDLLYNYLAAVKHAKYEKKNFKLRGVRYMLQTTQGRFFYLTESPNLSWRLTTRSGAINPIISGLTLSLSVAKDENEMLCSS